MVIQIHMVILRMDRDMQRIAYGRESWENYWGIVSKLLQMEKMEVQDGGILAEGILHVSFLYVKANDEVPFGVWKGMVPFSAMLECREGSSDMKYDITYAVEQLAVDLAGNDEVEIKAVVAFKSFM